MVDRLHTLLDGYDRLQLECDGMTRVCSHILRMEEIEHVVVAGWIEDTVSNTGFDPHYWIEIRDEPAMRIDYRARMWLGDAAHIPHGIIRSDPTSPIRYHGVQEWSPTEFDCGEVIFAALIGV